MRWTSWAVRPNEPSGFRGRRFIEPCFGIGHNLSLICQLTSEDIKHHFISPSACHCRLIIPVLSNRFLRTSLKPPLLMLQSMCHTLVSRTVSSPLLYRRPPFGLLWCHVQ